jgi:hypothetical protein
MIYGKDFLFALLSNGDIVQEGDEYYNPKHDKWLRVSDGDRDEDGNYPEAIIGYEYNSDETKPIRRHFRNIKP